MEQFIATIYVDRIWYTRVHNYENHQLIIKERLLQDLSRQADDAGVELDLSTLSITGEAQKRRRCVDNYLITATCNTYEEDE